MSQLSTVDPSFLQEDDFCNYEHLTYFIRPLLKYLNYKNVNNNNNKAKKPRAVCYRCGKPGSLHFYQFPTFTRIADEIIDTHPLCENCSSRRK